MSKRKKRNWKALILGSASIAGQAINGALTYLAASPADAAAAGAAGALFERGIAAILGDVMDRQLSERETLRVGATTTFALARIQERLQAGDLPRAAVFPAGSAASRTSAVEIVEGVLLMAKSEHEEKKLRLMGNFIANLAFTPELSVGEANHLLRLCESISYRQMVAIAVIKHKERIGSIRLRGEDFTDPSTRLPTELVSLVQESYDLADLGLVWRQVDESRVESPLMNWRFVTPREMSLTPLGEHLAVLIDTDTIPAQDVHIVANLLGQGASAPGR